MHIDLDALKQSISIVALAGRCGFKVVRKGQATFSTVEHDSLVLFPNDNSWHRFATGDGGDVVDFLMYWQRCDFKQAVEQLQGIAAIAPCPVVYVPPPPPPPVNQDLARIYHANLSDSDIMWWHGEGINDTSIAKFMLGSCDHPVYGHTYTIPVFNDEGRLLVIRHRIAHPLKSAGDKYRPEPSGVGAQLFNVAAINAQATVLVAGEKKAIVLSQYGVPAISTTGGCSCWKPEWTLRLGGTARVYIAYDPTPNEQEHAWRVARRLGDKARVVALPDKPDDFLLREGVAAFRECVRASTTVAEHDAWEKARQQSERMVRV